MTAPTSRSKGGRPRDPLLAGRVEQAAARVMAREGVESLSMSDVAAEAACGKASIYRRWPSKNDLLVDVIAACTPRVEWMDRASLHDDLTTLLADLTSGPDAAAVRAALPSVAYNARLRTAWSTGPAAARLGAIAELFDRAADRGDTIAASGTGWLLVEAALDRLTVRALATGRAPTGVDCYKLAAELHRLITRPAAVPA